MIKSLIKIFHSLLIFCNGVVSRKAKHAYFPYKKVLHPLHGALIQGWMKASALTQRCGPMDTHHLCNCLFFLFIGEKPTFITIYLELIRDGLSSTALYKFKLTSKYFPKLQGKMGISSLRWDWGPEGWTASELRPGRPGARSSVL